MIYKAQVTGPLRDERGFYKKLEQHGLTYQNSDPVSGSRIRLKINGPAGLARDLLTILQEHFNTINLE